MKNVVLFATGAAIGAVVGACSVVAALFVNTANYDDVLYEDDKLKIRRASDPDKDGDCIALVRCKNHKTTNK